jgi:hypothetical protein
MRQVPNKKGSEEKGLLYEIARWRIPKENSKKHLECWREILERTGQPSL